MMNTEQFIEKAKQIHGSKYDYSKVDYKKTHEKVCIICPTHGEFWQTPASHLKKRGCPKCANSVKITKEEFIEKAIKVHGYKYDYSQITYINNRTKIKIICPEHGEFYQTPYKHLIYGGCQRCSNKYRRNTIDFIDEARKIHGDKYDYSKVDYKNKSKKVCIICPTHGEFWQTPEKHLYRQHGCPKCKQSKLEKSVRDYLISKNIFFEEQKKFEWLGKQSLDFYLPKENIAIECQGLQHFEPVDFGGFGEEWAKERFNYIQKCDMIKKDLLKQNGINLIYYSDLNIDFPYDVKTSLVELIKC